MGSPYTFTLLNYWPHNGHIQVLNAPSAHMPKVVIQKANQGLTFLFSRWPGRVSFRVKGGGGGGGKGEGVAAPPLGNFLPPLKIVLFKFN